LISIRPTSHIDATCANISREPYGEMIVRDDVFPYIAVAARYVRLRSCRGKIRTAVLAFCCILDYFATTKGALRIKIRTNRENKPPDRPQKEAVEYSSFGAVLAKTYYRAYNGTKQNPKTNDYPVSVHLVS
jgi:hypothetical protein